ncbi:MAG: DNA-3-methyladenine glycosylase I [Oscillospiraceae bacterium]
MPEIQRCPWAKDALERAYHDNEWGVPEHDDQKLFELLILENMQAGLSWNLILHRRDAMRRAFDGFDVHAVAQYDDAKKAALLQDASIIRNRAKINALVGNARAFLAVQAEAGSFDKYIWSFVRGVPIHNHWSATGEIPVSTPLSDAISKDLKKRGFRFVGSVICYSYMQAIGMVCDHLTSCHFHPDNLG